MLLMSTEVCAWDKVDSALLVGSIAVSLVDYCQTIGIEESDGVYHENAGAWLYGKNPKGVRWKFPLASAVALTCISFTPEKVFDIPCRKPLFGMFITGEIACVVNNDIIGIKMKMPIGD